MATQTKAVATQPKALVKWKGEQIIVTFSDVKNLICRLATDQEAAVFLKTCQSLQLNPFANEIYLIKYAEKDKAATVISIGSYHKAAETNKDYNGSEAGIILRDSGGKLEFREGAFLLDDEMDKLVGGWARVYRKNRDRPTYIAVNKTECIRYTKEGRPTQFWTKEKQASMLRKTALKRALVEAFPSLFAGTISTAEVAEPVEAEYEEMPEGEVPSAMEKGGQPDWKKFWARAKSELGLTTEDARLLLQVDSIKEELVDQSWTMEDIWNKLVSSLQQQKTTGKKHEQVKEPEEWQTVSTRSEETEPEQVVDVQAGEIITREEDLLGEDEEAGSAAPAEEDKPNAGAAARAPKRNPETIRTINDLLKACNQDFKLQPKDIYQELGYKSQSEITEKPSECYIRIAAVRG
jgi:phage recombination protein Bet